MEEKISAACLVYLTKSVQVKPVWIVSPSDERVRTGSGRDLPVDSPARASWNPGVSRALGLSQPSGWNQQQPMTFSQICNQSWAPWAVPPLPTVCGGRHVQDGSGQDLRWLPGRKKREPPVLREARPVTGADSLLPSVLMQATHRTTDPQGGRQIPPLHGRLRAHPTGRKDTDSVRSGDCLQ